VTGRNNVEIEITFLHLIIEAEPGWCPAPLSVAMATGVGVIDGVVRGLLAGQVLHGLVDGVTVAV
jgi:hypothetical protein